MTFQAGASTGAANASAAMIVAGGDQDTASASGAGGAFTSRGGDVTDAGSTGDGGDWTGRSGTSVGGTHGETALQRGTTDVFRATETATTIGEGVQAFELNATRLRLSVPGIDWDSTLSGTRVIDTNRADNLELRRDGTGMLTFDGTTADFQANNIVTTGDFLFGAAATAPLISQTIHASGNAEDLTVSAQDGGGASGTGGDLIHGTGSGAGAGVDGSHIFQVGGTTIAQLTSPSSTTFEFDQSVTSAQLQIASKATFGTGVLLLIDGQDVDQSGGANVGGALTMNAGAATNGTTNTGGDATFGSGVGATADGFVYIKTGATTALTFDPTIGSGVATFTFNLLTSAETIGFTEGITGPTVGPAGKTTAAHAANTTVFGQDNAFPTAATWNAGDLTVRAGNVTDADNDGNAGDLYLAGGTINGGSGTAGDVIIQAGGATELTITGTNATFEASIIAKGASIVFDSSAALPTYGQVARTTLGTGALLSITAQDALISGGSPNVGAALSVRAGNAANGSTNTGGDFTIGSGSGATANGSIFFKLGSNDILQLTSPIANAYAFVWDSETLGSTGEAGMIIDDRTTTGNAPILSINAGNAWSGGTGKGGSIKLEGGSGFGTDENGGDIELTSGEISATGGNGVSKIILTNEESDMIVVQNNGGTVEMGFFGVTPTARFGALTQTYSTATATHAALTSATLTDSTTGNANTTVVDVTGSFNQGILNDNFADIIAQVNALRVDLENAKQFLNQSVDGLQLYGLFQ
jgi:hypothetical protein